MSHTNNNTRKYRVWGAASALSAALAMTLAASPAAAAEWDFTPRLSASGTWTDNVTAAGKGDEESEFITALQPGFRFGLQGPRADLSLDYSAQALWYRDNSEFDDVFHNLLGTGLFTLVPNHFFIDAFARYDQENIDPGGRVSTGNFLRTGNRTDAAVFGISPWYQSRIGDWGETNVRYRYQEVRFRNTDATDLRVRNSDTQSFFARLGSRQGSPGLSWNSRVSYSFTEFDAGSEFEYGQAALDVGYPVGVRSRVTATVGVESDVATDPSKGGFDESFWYLGYLWEPTDRQRLEARIGERYYGTAYEFSWTRQGARGDLSVSYTETPTTANQRLFDGEGTFSGGRPGLPALDTGVFLSKRLNGRVTYNLVRTQLSANVYFDQRERQGVDPLAARDDEVWGTRLAADWDIARRTRVSFFTRYEDRSVRGSDASSDLFELGGSVRRDLTRNAFTQLRVTHFRRNADTRDDYRINAVTLSVGTEF